MGFKDQLNVVFNLPCKVKYLVYKYIQYNNKWILSSCSGSIVVTGSIIYKVY